jgi:hypothetical protein
MRARQAVSVGGDDGASIQAFLIVIGQSPAPAPQEMPYLPRHSGERTPLFTGMRSPYVLPATPEGPSPTLS